MYSPTWLLEETYLWFENAEVGHHVDVGSFAEAAAATCWSTVVPKPEKTSKNP